MPRNQWKEVKLQKVAEQLISKGYNYGYATFWNANETMLRSNGQVQIGNIKIENGKLVPQKYQTMKDWYLDIPGNNRYFVMLDYIYRNVTSRNDVGTYIIFTGDGHFQSVVKYLVQKRHKKVVVYGVTDTFSKRLQGVASDIRLLPDEEELNNSYMRMIVRNLAHVEAKANIIPTFWGTIEAVSKRNNVPDDRVKATLLRMMANGYVFQKDFSINSSKQVRIVAADWKKIKAAGLYDEG